MPPAFKVFKGFKGFMANRGKHLAAGESEGTREIAAMNPWLIRLGGLFRVQQIVQQIARAHSSIVWAL
jgi:hypothetical protein